MVRPRRYALVALVWLTAVTTVIGGTPRLSCLCPNGETKPLCLGTLTPSTSSCCCGGACCSAEPIPTAAAASPCCSHAAPAGEEAGVESACCEQQLIEADVQAAPEKAGGVSKHSLNPVWLPLAESIASVANQLQSSARGFIPPAVPPPDRVVVFQHLLI
jgi:hypothetical protein